MIGLAVADAVGACMAAIEVVDDRYLDYRALDTPTLVADDFFNAACVLGRRSRVGARSTSRRCRAHDDQRAEVGSGRGGDILGHPLEALAWLANALASRGQFLKAREFVLLGSMVETRWVEQGDWLPRRSRASARRCAQFI